ncbi:hypothetical protein C8Q77DRAFT_1208043 [Trametes polyzona]|nr:hypothetical protein C8Q77DRAFT_1208043 [Trametes polyzona]
MPFPLIPSSTRTTQGAGRPTTNYINLDDYTDPSTPPSPTGWTWCESMNVWLPDDLPVSSGILYNSAVACTHCPSASSATNSSSASSFTSSQSKLPRQWTSKEYWRRLFDRSHKTVKDRPIVSDWFVVQASGVTFSQIRLQALGTPESCSGSGDGGLHRQYLF